jgi:NADH-quinone oxidoreductase subunit L
VLSAAAVRRALRPVHTLLVEKYYLDYLYEQIIVGRLLWAVTGVLALFDALVVDGAVNGVAATTREFGERLRRVQSGQLQAYGAAAFAGLVIAAALVFVLSG